jgi:hypothetical protein
MKVQIWNTTVFPKGIPVPDGLRVTGVIDAGEVNRFLGEILLKTPHLAGVVAFPYGIPWPEIFRVNIDIGATVESGIALPQDPVPF